MAKQISWLENWNQFDWTGLNSKQLKASMKSVKKLARPYIDLYLTKANQGLSGAKKYKITQYKWSADRTNPAILSLVVFLNPPALEIGTTTSSSGGGSKSQISPTPPPQP
jgi:hypothetical protein